MELWIRSQRDNKNVIQSLSKVDNVWICDTKPTTIEDHDGPLGEYKTKKRALEVLDEIQSILMPKIMAYNPLVESKEDYQNHNMKTELVGYATEYDVFALPTYVYEMPKD